LEGSCYPPGIAQDSYPLLFICPRICTLCQGKLDPSAHEDYESIVDLLSSNLVIGRYLPGVVLINVSCILINKIGVGNYISTYSLSILRGDQIMEEQGAYDRDHAICLFQAYPQS
jgi:hypothetical protein